LTNTLPQLLNQKPPLLTLLDEAQLSSSHRSFSMLLVLKYILLRQLWSSTLYDDDE
jgi:hypothetical protein